MNDRFLATGLAALGRAGQEKASAWGQGHWGAALITAHFLRESLEGEARTALKAQTEAFRESHPTMFAPAPSESALALPEAEEAIMAAFARRAGELCAIGHNVIFTTLALRGLRTAPEQATPFVVEGIAKLIAAFAPNPGYFFVEGKPKVIRPDPAAFVPPAAAEPWADWAREVLADFRGADRTYAGELGDMQLGHILTHGEAVTSLAELGHADLARAAFGAFRARMALFAEARRLSPPQPGPKPPAFRPPTTEAFWVRDFRPGHWWGEGHLFKYTASLLTLRRQAGEVGPPIDEERFALLER